MLLYRYREHMKYGNYGVGAEILLDGLELEKLVFPQQQLGGITRSDMQHEKYDDRHTQQGGNQNHYSAQNIGQHRLFTLLLRRVE